jgi:lysophospholipase L1-like esterase
MDPTPFLRGNAFPGTPKVAYPRAQPGDTRLPQDTWYMAQVPVGVRLELAGDAETIVIGYETRNADPGWQGDAGRVFELWRDGVLAQPAIPAEVGEGQVSLPLGAVEHAIIYLPERMLPRIKSIDVLNGSVQPGPPQPRWICYGDSIAEGWVASSPSSSWAATAAREHGLDIVNMGYAGAARGELASADQIAQLKADVISLTHGTNCWLRALFTPELMRESFKTFLDVVRTGHPETPIVFSSPLLRPEAEETPNKVGATLVDLRDAMEEVARARDDVILIPGRDLIDGSMLADEVHPNDTGHAAIAAALGPVIAKAVA